MSDTMQSLDQLSSLKPAAPEAPKYVKKVDKFGRAYATGKRKDAVARVWIKPGAGKITVNTREVEVYFARPVLRMMIQQPLVAAARAGQYDVDLHRRRRRSVGPGRRRASRHLQGADLFRAGSARRAEEGRLPDPRQPHRRAQEVRPRQGAQVVPVLEALIASLKFAAIAAIHRTEKGRRKAPLFVFEFGDELTQFFPKTCVRLQTNSNAAALSVSDPNGAASLFQAAPLNAASHCAG